MGARHFSGLPVVQPVGTLQHRLSSNCGEREVRDLRGQLNISKLQEEAGGEHVPGHPLLFPQLGCHRPAGRMLDS